MIIDPINKKERGITISPLKTTVENASLDTLDQEFLNAVSEKMAVMQEMKMQISTLTQRANGVTDPATLIKIQALMADYSLNVDLTSKIAQRLLTGIDSLVKS